MAKTNLALAACCLLVALYPAYAEDLADIRLRAGTGCPATQTRLGAMYRFGEGVEQDKAMAVTWLTRAAEQGDAVAQSHLGAMYRSGEGVEQDKARAVKWLTLARSSSSFRSVSL